MPAQNDAGSGMGQSWQSTFGADSREQVEQRMRELGSHWERQFHGCLRATTPVRQAVRQNDTGQKVSFTQFIAVFLGGKETRIDPSSAIRFGNGERLSSDAVPQVAEIADQLTFDVPWQPGDVPLIDNFVVMHGRHPFRGNRKVLASLVANTPSVPAKNSISHTRFFNWKRLK